MDGSIFEALVARRARADPWLTFHDSKVPTQLSWAEAHTLVLRWAQALWAQGVRPGERVLLLAPNGPTFVGAFLAAQALGASAVPVAWPFFPEPVEKRQRRLAAIIEVCAPAAAVTVPGQEQGWPCPVVTAPAATPLLSSNLGAPGAPAFIQFTSGTTGRPKGATISPGAALHNAWGIGEALGLDETEVGVSWLPLFHDMGLVGALLTSLVRGFQLHILRPGDFLLRPSRWIKLMSEVSATLTVAPNFAYDLAVKKCPEVAGLDLSALKYALNGSEPVHRATLDRFSAHFAQCGLRQGALRPVYGLAENTLAVAFSGAGEPDLRFEGRDVPSVGRPLANTSVRIRGEAGGWARPGQQGEIWVMSPSLMSGYWRQDDLTAQTIEDGWLRTGDLGVMRDGLVYVTGRSKDLVIKGGTKFHPYEIERIVSATLDTPPGGVAAFSMRQAGHEAELLVVALELRSQLCEGAERQLRGALVDELGLRPDKICIVRPGALPRTTSGKVRRSACAAALAGAL